MHESTGHGAIAPLSQEMQRADLGDRRLGRRLGLLVDSLSAKPGESFPKSLTPAELEGGYRFFHHPRVTPDSVLQPHYQATAQRAAPHPVVRLVHDSSNVEFTGEVPRRGLGPLRGKGQGFFAHVTLAVGDGEDRVPLGVLALTTWVRVPKARRLKGQKKGQRSKRGGRTDGESLRWSQQAKQSQERLRSGNRVVHVMDREADSYALFHALAQSEFVIRAAHDRVVELPPDLQLRAPDKLRRVIAQAPILLEREVRLSRRRPAKSPRARKIHPLRQSRLARLAIRAQRIRLKRTEYVSPDLPPWIELNVVQVIEVDPPTGTQPVEWILLTNLPIDTPDHVAAVVDHYRARWIIEEFFKALKTGCRIETRQLQDLPALLNMLATFLPVAWQMLFLRTLAQRTPKAPATAALTETQLKILGSIAHLKLPSKPNLRMALLAVARLGGHLAHNGEPGWQTLARGFHDLLLLEIGWHARALDQDRRSDKW